MTLLDSLRVERTVCDSPSMVSPSAPTNAHVHIAAYKWRDITRVGTLQTEVLNRTSILLVQSKARVISSSENKKIEFLLKTDVTVSVSVRCFLKNPSHGQVVRVRTKSPFRLQRFSGSNLNQSMILLVQSEARIISSSENSKKFDFYWKLTSLSQFPSDAF